MPDFRTRFTPLEDLILERFERPVLQLRWPAARIKILVVSDGNDYGMSPFGFGLGFALTDAFDTAHPDHPDYARFEFTKAHRTNAVGVTAGFENFRFTAGSLDNFDELWLFGFTPGAPYLSAAELGVVHGFMDRGGGVLAMGDHEDLGLGLCGGIKRVRSMRKWWFDGPAPPANMEVAPDGTDLTRNDTVHAPTPGGSVNAGSQSDATPQRIYPRYRYRWQWSFLNPYRRVKYPHPVLCGPRGVIKVMPDHAHEGDCIIPNAAFANEYPGSVDVEIVADGRNVVGRTKGGFTIVDPRAFGLIGAWDGHHDSANAGRVLVDSTWHHWFNVNLTGLRDEGGVEYDDVLAFFRNCAIWLAPESQQAAMRRAGTLISLFTPTLIEHTVSLKKLVPQRFYPFGIFARDALGRIAPQCQSAAWLFELIRPHLTPSLIKRLELIEKRGPDGFDPIESRFDSVMLDVIGTTVLGGAMQAIAAEISPDRFAEVEKLGERVDRIATKGAEQAAKLARERLTKLDGHFAALLR